MSWQDAKSETRILSCSISNLVVSQETGYVLHYDRANQIGSKANSYH